MVPAMKQQLMGAVKTAVSQACGLILGLPLTDPEHFAITNVGGWKHISIAIAVVVVAGEARYWKSWADSVTQQVGSH